MTNEFNNKSIDVATTAAYRWYQPRFYATTHTERLALAGIAHEWTPSNTCPIERPARMQEWLADSDRYGSKLCLATELCDGSTLHVSNNINEHATSIYVQQIATRRTIAGVSIKQLYALIPYEGHEYVLWIQFDRDQRIQTLTELIERARVFVVDRSLKGMQAASVERHLELCLHVIRWTRYLPFRCIVHSNSNVSALAM
jgi:hypothetical protein